MLGLLLKILLRLTLVVGGGTMIIQPSIAKENTTVKTPTKDPVVFSKDWSERFDEARFLLQESKFKQALSILKGVVSPNQMQEGVRCDLIARAYAGQKNLNLAEQWITKALNADDAGFEYAFQAAVYAAQNKATDRSLKFLTLMADRLSKPKYQGLSDSTHEEWLTSYLAKMRKASEFSVLKKDKRFQSIQMQLENVKNDVKKRKKSVLSNLKKIGCPELMKQAVRAITKEYPDFKQELFDIATCDLEAEIPQIYFKHRVAFIPLNSVAIYGFYYLLIDKTVSTFELRNPDDFEPSNRAKLSIYKVQPSFLKQIEFVEKSIAKASRSSDHRPGEAANIYEQKDHYRVELFNRVFSVKKGTGKIFNDFTETPGNDPSE